MQFLWLFLDSLQIQHTEFWLELSKELNHTCIELNGISEGGANCIVSERADDEIQVGGREDPMRIEQKRMRELS